ncbi:hypothetical protein GobsT_01170 [Gemmata obscuriglobus]|uniref:Uncharacterized protein n=1 Tax=Gemmata obscuriglobus TaxID=114 RepID=A0A2Z3HA19_9BACT|nr:hypothetical protein [Gemmata obscuriglobus]AWM41262.1 hypothetical protein C1280_32565 [Gemmata obscuriglobus]QEG25392.1 hypothetical protein GobsT_01170 [Gemmata obscuriglobus]VTR98438.1 unnamed protein product [Gemmata obscuriglobus UQM 2246]
MPDPALQSTALRYAAGDLGPAEVATFEERLAFDQEARDAVAEAVRLSAAAFGQSAPKPGAAFRAGLRERLTWTPSRGLTWATGGAAVAAVCAMIGLALADHAEPPSLPATHTPTASQTAAPAAGAEPDALTGTQEAAVLVAIESPGTACGDDRTVAEIWAELSSHEHVEKARDDEARWRQKVQNLAHPSPFSSAHKADAP